MESRQGRVLFNIQSLRGLAALLVIFVHLPVLLAALGLQPFGGGGVDLFFVISGFIMVYTTYGKDTGPGRFLRHRIIRIVPLYWLMTLAVFAVALTVPALLQNTVAAPSQLIKSLLFIPFYKNNGFLQPVLFVGWTLNYEMFFYLIFALSLLLKSTQYRLVLTVGVLIAFTCASGIGQPGNPFVEFYTSPLILEFALGMVIGVAFKQEFVFSAAYWRYLLIAVFAGGVALLVFLPLGGGAGWQEFFARGIPAAMAVWAASSLEKRGDSLTAAALVSMGDASYSMYLTHPFVAQTFEKLGVRLHAGRGLSLVLILGCVAAVLLTAQIVHRAVERPAIRLARRYWSGRVVRVSRQVA